MMVHSGPGVIEQKINPSINYIYAYPATTKELPVHNIVEQPIINFKYDRWNSSGSPNTAISDTDISSYIAKLLDHPSSDNFNSIYYSNPSTGYFCSSCFDDTPASCPCSDISMLPGKFPLTSNPN